MPPRRRPTNKNTNGDEQIPNDGDDEEERKIGFKTARKFVDKLSNSCRKNVVEHLAKKIDPYLRNNGNKT